MKEKIIKKLKFDGKEFETVWRKAKEPLEGEITPENRDTYGFCVDFNPETYFPRPEIICQRDVGVKMRDGVTIYADIYRPNTAEKVPVIVCWSSYGKRPVEGKAFLSALGVPRGTISEMCKFESPDPGYWCRNGYAIANVDPRGIDYSEGDVTFYGNKDAEDGHDFIEWIAIQDWCNGKVGMGGNSMVAIYQWFIASTQPKHLACIAPWEGSCDKYRENIFEGGIPATSFNGWLVGVLIGKGYVDDIVEMVKKYPFMNEYWEDKAAKLEKIKIPVYMTASWSHFHVHGAFEGWSRIRSSKKWMRAHRDFEWPDMYTPENIEDLKRFYDRYLKDINNGWEMTPRVRLDVMDAYEFDYQLHRPENEFPLKRTEYTKYYLDANTMTLQDSLVEKEASYSYDAQTGIANFDMKFNEDTELTGYMKLRLWVECQGHNEMDLFVNIQKLSTEGKWIPTSVLGEPHPGAWGKIRVSRRELDEDRSTEYKPVLLQKREQKLSDSEIVPVDISIWPHSRIWHKGQSLRIQISGRYIREGWFEPLQWETDNGGEHIIHTGGKYESYLLAPVIPPKFKDGDYCYR